MTKLKANIPSVPELENYLKKRGLKKLIRRFSCYEYLIGDTESLDFLREKYNEYKEQKIKEDENI